MDALRGLASQIAVLVVPASPPPSTPGDSGSLPPLDALLEQLLSTRLGVAIAAAAFVGACSGIARVMLANSLPAVVGGVQVPATTPPPPSSTPTSVSPAAAAAASGPAAVGDAAAPISSSGGLITAVAFSPFHLAAWATEQAAKAVARVAAAPNGQVGATAPAASADAVAAAGTGSGTSQLFSVIRAAIRGLLVPVHVVNSVRRAVHNAAFHGAKLLAAVLRQSLPSFSQVLENSPRLGGLLSLLCASSLLWLVSVRINDVSIVDPFWSLGFLILTAVFRNHRATATGFAGRKDLILLLVSLWAVRLSAYLFYRNYGQGEDFRYQAFRRRHGPKYWWVSLFQTFWLQSVLCFLVGFPLLTAQRGSAPMYFTDKDLVGATMWVVGFLFEAIGDLQLTLFKRNPANEGKLLTTGLWRFTRHPNYFGNALMFWGYYVIACNARFGWTTIPAPLLMTYLLTSLSGVPMLERSLIRKKPEFVAYAARTSAFIPWFPANIDSASIVL
ncbi:steroid 5-alpha reductase family enzyme [Capsaspora owczarzaki ATCC 30864]|uniref:Steroid 5-alpha reductase family enzyme n=1 Tax=Capsaspora owczarzaki (strain ATCC 30864) TaxID=595528 RepID=A0A0D2X1I6_CAPO3|nr:steroid 5-alpha reductase family enzyme [Capsaspora owczarzaki ATCC 30864]KJE90874.1 steroid 5-alpha reductase family enzyme [Capsaspora owczarzaki ATCC 30864]|eukprot:XP_004348861.2 steroid 5-alpha reductase family enzyme [Capsaspora owczarzaki ATCC 30864]